MAYTAEPVAVDGEPTEPAWSDAAELLLPGEPPAGRAKLTWDARFLYAIVDCPQADRVTGDSLTLKVAGRRRLHVKFEPDGNCWNLNSARTPSAMNRPDLLEYATYIHEQASWSVEIRIPLTAIGAVGHPVVLHIARLGAYTRQDPAAPAEAIQAEGIRRLVFDAPPAVSRP